MFVLSPSLAPFCGHHCGETIYLSADGFPVDHSYPFEETCLRKAFLRDDTGAPHCGGTVSLGLRGDAQSALDTGSFSGGTAFNGAITTSVEVSDEHITGRVHVGGALFWQESVPHSTAWPQTEIRLDKILSSEGGCDEECGSADCASGECDGYDGPSLGSLRFRISLGEPRANQHSAFLYLDEDAIPASVAPSAFRLRRRPDATVADTTDAETGVRTVVCSDPHGRTLQIAPIDGGAEIAVSLTATGEAVCTWRVERTAPNAIRFRRFALNGDAMSDETISLAANGDWERADAIGGLVETLSLPEPWQDDAKSERRVLRDAAGKVLTDSWTDFSRVDTPTGPATRETMRTLEHGTGSWSDSFAEYWTNSGLPGRDGLPALARSADGRTVVTDYDADGRTVLRMTSRSADWLYSRDVSQCADPLDALAQSDDAMVETFDYTPPPSDTAAAQDAKTPRRVSRYLKEPDCPPVLVSREWTTITRGIAAPHGAAVRVRTERAAFPDAAPGAQGNAVSSVLRYDEAAPGVPLPLRGAPILETDEDGVETRHEHDFGAWDTATLAFTPVPSGASGAFLRIRTLRAPAAAPSGVPGVTTVAETIRDAALGTEVFSCTRAVLPGGEFSEPFEWRATARDDRNRVTCVRYYDGTYSSNEWSCCRLLATTDRTGARTLRSSSPALTRVYYAEEAASMAALPHSEKFIPYESPYSNEEAAIGVTQRWFDSLGRETNTVRRTDLTPGASADPARTRSRGIGWFATNSVAYPAGESRLSVETDARGVRTRRASHIDAETGVTATFADTYAPGVLTDSIVEQYLETEESIPDLAASHSVNTESHIDGTTVTRESFDGGASWIETTSDTLFAPDGARTERTTVVSSDGASDGVSLRRHDLLGRLVEIDAPGDHRVFSYAPGSMRVAGESNLLSGVASERIYDSVGAEIGSTAHGVTAETRVHYALDASNALWRVTRSAVFSDDPATITNRWTEMREQLTRLPASVLSRTEIASSVGETSSTVLERESETSPVRRETTISNVSGTRVRRIQFGRVIEETTSGGTTYHYFDAFGRSFTTDHSDPGETAKKHRTWTGRNRFGDIGEEDEFWRGGTTDAAVHATFFGFDHFGHLSSSTNAVGGASEFSADFRGNRTSESGATYPELQAYDSAGRRIGLSTTRGGTAWDATVWSYAAATGLCTNKTYADGSAVSYTYTPDLLPMRTTRPSGHWTEYSYNSRRDRVATLSDDPSVAAAFQFDVFGRETAFSNSVSSSMLTRDSRGNVTNETTSVGGESFALVRGFDEAGRMSSVNGTHYSYAEDGLLAGVSNAAAVVTYEYAPDRADAGYEITLANGTTITRRVQREAYRRALATNITTSVSGTTVETLAYSFDALGRPVSRNADSFGYNARSEVVFSRGGAENAENTYAYDHIGNLTLHESPAATNAYTANNLNQYTAISNLCASAPLCEINPAYDTDGNLVSDGVFAYAYDSANRLTAVSSNGISVATFAYDAKSRRVRKTTPSATHTYFYDDWNLVKETVQRSNGSTVQRTYVWGKDLSGTLQGAGGVGGLLAVIHDNIPYFPCYDNNGNITRYLDASGATVAAYTYDAFGRTISATGPLADTFPHRFSTKYFDPETYLYYYGYRYYSPTLMRWLNRDPIEEKGGLNLYAFCDNNAVLKLDAIGLKCMIESGPKLLPNEVWHLVHLSFESDRHDGVLLLRGIEAIWRRKGIVYCCCRGKSTKKTVYRIHNAKFTFDPVANGGPPLGLSPEISGPLSVPIPLSGTRALGELLGAIAFDITGPPAMFDDENFQRLKDGIRRTRPNDNSGNWPDDPCN